MSSAAPSQTSHLCGSLPAALLFLPAGLATTTEGVSPGSDVASRTSRSLRLTREPENEGWVIGRIELAQQEQHRRNSGLGSRFRCTVKSHCIRKIDGRYAEVSRGFMQYGDGPGQPSAKNISVRHFPRSVAVTCEQCRRAVNQWMKLQ